MTEHLLASLSQKVPGHGLPPAFYTDESLLALETEQLFQKQWHCLGRADEIPETGDYFTIDLMQEPLLIVRSSSEDISVYSNVCRHRGMPVASGCGNTKKFRCPYHAWTYGLDGALRSAPLVPKEQLDADCALPKLPSRIWQGFIFVSFASDAEWLDGDNSLQPLEQHIANYHMASMHHAVSFNEVWDCNWKSLVENFMDGYHLSVVHPQTLHHLTPTSLCKKVSGSDAFTAYTANYADTAPSRENHHPSVTTEQARQSQLFCIFPALIASLSADTLVYLSLSPLSVGQVAVKWGIATYESELSADELESRVQKWQRINEEDHQILSRLHQGLQSKYSTNGPLAADNFEGTLHDFHSYLTDRLYKHMANR